MARWLRRVTLCYQWEVRLGPVVPFPVLLTVAVSKSETSTSVACS